ncbi:hypothetical protein ACHHYP_13347 [Achlya hypogyna]|uniref:Secreted protein n=1 Tax=Achlya hypogyna TaxID=1202772 RepID=A0A1V9YFI9_ACHHY|nr:hypothetical protein ACHHYP_13347 [Achlya hypogyna]
MGGAKAVLVCHGCVVFESTSLVHGFLVCGLALIGDSDTNRSGATITLFLSASVADLFVQHDLEAATNTGPALLVP